MGKVNIEILNRDIVPFSMQLNGYLLGESSAGVKYVNYPGKFCYVGQDSVGASNGKRIIPISIAGVPLEGLTRDVSAKLVVGIIPPWADYTQEGGIVCPIPIIPGLRFKTDTVDGTKIPTVDNYVAFLDDAILGNDLSSSPLQGANMYCYDIQGTKYFIEIIR